MVRCSSFARSVRYRLSLCFHIVCTHHRGNIRVVKLTPRFEGMKAYRQEDDTVRLFRPDKNMARMNKVRRSLYTSCAVWLTGQSAARLALPVCPLRLEVETSADHTEL
jgi:hypothetical protein